MIQTFDSVRHVPDAEVPARDEWVYLFAVCNKMMLDAFRLAGVPLAGKRWDNFTAWMESHPTEAELASMIERLRRSISVAVPAAGAGDAPTIGSGHPSLQKRAVPADKIAAYRRAVAERDNIKGGL